MKDAQIQKAYEAAKERYAEIGVNTDAVLEQIAKVSLSLHCWQTDDVTGFENPDGQLSGRHPNHGQLPRQGPQHRGGPQGHRKGQDAAPR